MKYFETPEGYRITLLRKNKHPNKSEFMCYCGNEFLSRYSHVSSGRTKSCGCRRPNKEWDYKKLGNPSSHPLYKKLMAMKSRCYYPKNICYSRYGGRGIRVCDEWLKSFNAFYRWSIEKGWELGLEIDRINVDGDYSPDNCRYVTPSENMKESTERNKRGRTGIYSTESENKVIELSKKNQGKKVKLIDRDSGFEYTFISMGEAAQFIKESRGLETKHTRIKSNVSACCLGKRKSCHNFICNFI